MPPIVPPRPEWSPAPDYVSPPEKGTDPNIRIARRAEKTKGNWKTLGALIGSTIATGLGGVGFHHWGGGEQKVVETSIKVDDTRDKVIRLEADKIRKTGRSAQGVRLIKVDADDMVTSASLVDPSTEEEIEETPAS
jgi:DNA gyrase/topoisomerase IV subunit A